MAASGPHSRKKKVNIRGSASVSSIAKGGVQEREATSEERAEFEKQLQKFEIGKSDITMGKKLGVGTFGEVFEGTLHGKDVAVKRLIIQDPNQNTLDAFRKEIALFSNLKHPNVLLFMGACTEVGDLMIVTELMRKGSVRKVLKREKKKLTFAQRMDMARQAAQGMNCLHNTDPVTIHRDLKTPNLLVDEDGRVKVADFGLSHVKAQGDDPAAYGTVGTPLWIAPEVLQNESYNEKCDLYSYGMVLWEILTGSDPFPEIETYSSMVQAVCQEHKRPVIPANCPPTLKKILEACWDANPENRPSFQDILDDFESIVIEGTLKDKRGIRFWKKYFKEETEVTWDEFIAKFTKFLGKELVNEEMTACLEMLLAKDDEVTMDSFYRFLQWFGPLNGKETLDTVRSVLSEEWFHGDISSGQTEKLLKGASRTGTYLVRFSSRDPGSYAISAKAKSGKKKEVKVNHFRVQHSPGGKYQIGKAKCSSLQSVIKNFSKDLGLKVPCPGSKYQAIFTHKEEEDDPTMGYLDPDDL